MCAICHRLDIRISEANDVGRDCSEVIKELAEHKEKADVAYLHLKLATKKKIWDPTEWTLLCMDLQQTHLIPKTPVGTHYYARKLNVYNFCISEVQTQEPFFYMWPEFIGRKGAAEIFSCVYKYLQDHVLCKPNYPKKLWIYADNCGGQNKNNKIVLALLR